MLQVQLPISNYMNTLPGSPSEHNSFRDPLVWFIKIILIFISHLDQIMKL